MKPMTKNEIINFLEREQKFAESALKVFKTEDKNSPDYTMYHMYLDRWVELDYILMVINGELEAVKR